MDSHEAARLGHKAKRETEAFINNYINDEDKGWPKVCNSGSFSNNHRQQKNIRESDIGQSRLTG